MKQFLFLVLISCSIVLQAQQVFILSDEYGTINAGDTITIYIENTYAVEKHIYITNTSSIDINVKVKKDELILLPGAFNTFCWGQCWAPHVTTSPISITIPAGQTNTTDFYADYHPNGNNGITLNKFTFFDESDTSVNTFVYIRFISTSTNIHTNTVEKISISAPYPNPADQWCRFTLTIPPVHKNASLKIIDLTGTVVLETPVETGTSTVRLHLDNLNQGIYFYSLFIDNKPYITRKLIIQR